MLTNKTCVQNDPPSKIHSIFCCVQNFWREEITKPKGVYRKRSFRSDKPDESRNKRRRRTNLISEDATCAPLSNESSQSSDKTHIDVTESASSSKANASVQNISSSSRFGTTGVSTSSSSVSQQALNSSNKRRTDNQAVLSAERSVRAKSHSTIGTRHSILNSASMSPLESMCNGNGAPEHLSVNKPRKVVKSKRSYHQYKHASKSEIQKIISQHVEDARKRSSVQPLDTSKSSAAAPRRPISPASAIKEEPKPKKVASEEISADLEKTDELSKSFPRSRAICALYLVDDDLDRATALLLNDMLNSTW